jgi:ribosomal protein S7
MINLDLYTKSILTVIATALIGLCLQNAFAPRVVSAQNPQTPQRVILDGVSQSMPLLDVHIRSVGGDAVVGPLPVRTPAPLAVRIVK